MNPKDLKTPDAHPLATHLLKHSFNTQELTQLTDSTQLSAIQTKSPELIAMLIREEPFDIQVMVLAHVDARKSFAILKQLPEDLRTKLAFAISEMDPQETSILNELNQFLELKLRKYIVLQQKLNP